MSSQEDYKKAKTTKDPVTVLQWNVFEDGLTDAPGNLGFPAEFDCRFSELLGKLCFDSSSEPYWGFSKTRDFSALPDVAPIGSTQAFFHFIDVLYCAMYHSIGGEARFGESPPGQHPDLANSLRCMFLRTHLPSSFQEPSATNRWETPEFEREIKKISAPPEVAARLRALHLAVFDGLHGCISWNREMIDGSIWKRGNNVWKDKWMADLKVFCSPPAEVKPSVSAALGHFVQVRKSSDPGDGAMTSMITMVLDEKGEVQSVRTLTLQSVVRWLLVALCEHSLGNAEAASAICTFAKISEAPGTAEERMLLVFPSVLNELVHWFSAATLTSRCDKIRRTVEEVSPDIMTLVEYDEQWRAQKLAPSSHVLKYSIKAGKGTAAIMFNEGKFDHVEQIGDFQVPDVVPVISAQLDSVADSRDYKIGPKSSCSMLLQRKCDSQLILVTAVHLESAPPSDTKKVNIRAVQVRAALAHVSMVTKVLGAAGRSCLVILGGDFNALAEELVYGNSDSFWQAPGVVSVRPPLRRPAQGATCSAPPTPPLARLSEDGRLYLACDGIDGGELYQASHSDKVSCTRAGSTMVIDFVFVGMSGSPAKLETSPLQIVTPEESAKASDKDYGVYNAVMNWGSDHLPVGAVVSLEQLAE